MRILIVDDEPFVIDMLRVALERRGHSVLTVTFFEEIEKLAGEHHFDAVILDYSMPYENGMVVLDKLKKKVQKPFSYVFYTKNAQGSGEWEALLRGGIPKNRIIQKVDVSEDVLEILDALRRK